ncbi:peptide-methionine (S)-S-oxide reductase MsrA [Halomonas sp. McH1-25]|uniref:peptide-methionine (S)-S-oxide reductase MsrA n=1 Tax=unclassified Halomonas TaxID=2609666 RepID=UPI001EF5CFBC|nr:MULTISPECIES: peptide-methionine (S)-S-oxide reductase MsrA [unclassified Halomonas]MCG7600962.1 peptide-methionine (S)-S-oxide reductase MsrA [Halomonas sp. McH1-25]MCP1342054.1 peptide-methionine (S)-S-oxide reductase MsrA [Halomonas sp. FL8]MCP1359764.1 peptide-methionine (S)-S-oxide reductase MsrA [Halomonas sp. BBD45]MCP1364924.1 peptide-methionine (S)-S-oxide reductase MsrA [Halomonas sp. BBD48]
MSAPLMFAWIALATLALPVQAQDTTETAQATFAGGCFWCMEEAYDEIDGVQRTISGYTDGDEQDPSYEQVASGATDHAEAVRVEYDPSQVDYATLLEAFWHNIDPFAEDRQFCDTGSQYRSAIFYHDEQQKQLAERTKADLEQRFGRDIATQIVPAGQFWDAEAYHQDYYEKNPVRYRFYKAGCGRTERLEEIWGDQAGLPGK